MARPGDSEVREGPAHERRGAVVVRAAAGEVHGAVLRHQNLAPVRRAAAAALRVGDVHRAEARPRVHEPAAALVVAPALRAALRRRAGVRHDERVALHGQALAGAGQQTSAGLELEHD